MEFKGSRIYELAKGGGGLGIGLGIEDGDKKKDGKADKKNNMGKLAKLLTKDLNLRMGDF
jgi:hypothetical protein